MASSTLPSVLFFLALGSAVALRTKLSQQSHEVSADLMAYWDNGHCGPAGLDDHNADWCGWEEATCRQQVIVPNSVCPSGVANLQSQEGYGWSNSVTRDGCEFAFFATYACQAPPMPAPTPSPTPEPTPEPTPACPSGYVQTNKNLDGAGKEWTPPLNSIGDCAQVCDQRSACTSFEYHTGNQHPGQCGTYTGGSSNMQTGAQTVGWVSCVKQAACVDGNIHCPSWASAGGCSNTMKRWICKRSCESCDQDVPSVLTPAPTPAPTSCVPGGKKIRYIERGPGGTGFAYNGCTAAVAGRCCSLNCCRSTYGGSFCCNGWR